MATLTEATARAAGATVRYAGATWHAVTYPYRVALQAVRRTSYQMALAFREAFNPEQLGGTGGIDNDDWQYRRLTKNGKRDLAPLTQSRQLEIAHWLWQRNPVARRILEITRDFVVGDGAQVHSDIPEVDERIKAFWNDQDNNLNEFQDQLALELGKAGEVFLPVFVNPDNGHVKLGWLDPGDVVAILTDPTNIRIPVAVKVKAGTGHNYLKVIRQEDDPAKAGFGRLMTATEGDSIVDPSEGTTARPYAGSCFLFQINRPPSATRGTSDLLPLADWLDALDSSVWNSLDRIAFLNAFVWDVVLEGKSEAEIDAWVSKQGAPKPGSVRAHNDKVTWNAVVPDLKMGDFSEGVRTHLNHVMGGAGLPSHWYGASDDVNRASAAEMSEPVLKRLTKRQQTVRHLLATLVRFALDQAVVHGQLDQEHVVPNEDGKPTAVVVDARDAFSLMLPELSAKDTGKLASAAREMVQALDVAIDRELLTPGSAREVMANLLAQIGVEIDLAEEEDELERLRAERDAQQAAQTEQQADDLRLRLAQMGTAERNGRATHLPAPVGSG